MEIVRLVKWSERGKPGKGFQEFRSYDFRAGMIRSAMHHAMAHSEQHIRAEKGFGTLKDGRENIGEFGAHLGPCPIVNLVSRCVLDDHNGNFIDRAYNAFKSQAQPAAVIDTIY